MTNVIEVVALKMIRYFGKDARRINHALKVHSFAGMIAASEAFAAEQRQILEIAALLHDIGIQEAERRYQSTAGHYQEELGPAIARALLQDLDIPGNALDRICYLIGHHHTYSQIDGPDYQILVEADFLVNIFEDPMDSAQIAAVRQKYFKTKAGAELLERMYL